MAIKYKMLDFAELDSNGDDFELLVRELLYNKGLEVYWSGKGPDGGRDLLCVEKYKSNFKNVRKRWLIQCKHNAHSGNAVGINDLGSIGNACRQHNADGYILVCSTYPSSSVVTMLEALEQNEKIVTSFWDYQTLERQLLTPANWTLISRFFPESVQKIGIQVSQISSDFWRIFYKGSVLYFSLRLGADFNNYLDYIIDRIEELQKIKMPEHQYLRLRAIYFDDKYCNFRAYCDYLIPEGLPGEEFRPSEEVIEFCSERCIDGLFWDTDVMFYECRYSSDSFDFNDKSYYSQFINDFRYGMERRKENRFSLVKRDDSFCFTEDSRWKSYRQFVENIKKVPYISILNASNSNIEDIGFFSDNFDWDEVIKELDFKIINFFEITIRFECEEFEQLCDLLNSFPQSVTESFRLDKNCIFLPEKGYEVEEDKIYTLRISVHPALITSKHHFRIQINQYLDKLTTCVEEYCRQNSY